MSDTKKKAFVKNWSQTRKMGKTLYIIKNGLLWGIVTFLLFKGLKVIFSDEYALSNIYEEIQGVRWWVELSLLTLIGGPIYGIITWHISERSFKRILKEMKKDHDFFKDIES